MKRIVTIAAVCVPTLLLAGCGKAPEPVVVEEAEPAVVRRSSAPRIGGSGRDVALVPGAGRILLIDIWARWSAPSRAGVEVINALQDRYGSHGLDVAGLSVDHEKPTDLEAVLDEWGVAYPCGLADDALLKEWGEVQVVPTRLLIGAGGDILERIEGWATFDGLAEKIEPYLLGRVPP